MHYRVIYALIATNGMSGGVSSVVHSFEVMTQELAEKAVEKINAELGKGRAIWVQVKR